ncbi:MAG: 30S ribosomal protein S9 [Candidatus Aenigmarchaeota archaeon]|nr:30S ribosomal protein S9 [Candidatus Aenigmarchaeota archaeon]
MVKQKEEIKKEKIIFGVGKRKNAVARARIKSGSGRILINNTPLDLVQPEYSRLKIRESILLAENLINQVDVNVDARGGGIAGQADATRQAIAKGLVEYFDNKNLKDKYLEYDRNLLVYDSRRTEPHKPSRSSQGARRHKQRSKR